MNIPENLKYTEEHEWVGIDGDILIIGITDYAQSELGDIVFIELPMPDENFNKSDTFGTVEAVKTVSDLYMPIKGSIIEVNENLEDNTELINTNPYGEGWIIKIKPENLDDINGLLSNIKYKGIIS